MWVISIEKYRKSAINNWFFSSILKLLLYIEIILNYLKECRDFYILIFIERWAVTVIYLYMLKKIIFFSLSLLLAHDSIFLVIDC